MHAQLLMKLLNNLGGRIYETEQDWLRRNGVSPHIGYPRSISLKHSRCNLENTAARASGGLWSTS